MSLNHSDRAEIVSMIQTNKAEFVAKQSNNRTLWRVNYQDQSLNVVYDKARNAMCTVLPKEAHEFQHDDVEHVKHEMERRSARAEITAELAEFWKDVE